MMMLHYKKTFIFQLFLFFYSWQTISASGGGNWSYFWSGGSKIWKKDYPKCGERQQSPVDIITDLTVSKDYGSIKIENYDGASMGSTLKNNGATVTAVLLSSPKAQISGGDLKDVYIGHSFHFHWGSSDGFGSEHYKDGTAFPMELHIVHYSSKYRDLSAAMDQPEGLAVLGFFFTITPTNNTVLQDYIKNFPQIKSIGAKIKMNTQLNLLIPENRDKYYRYAGSLTTPPCYESVVWTVFDSTIGVSTSQLEDFRTKLDMNAPGNNRKLFDNFRHLQPLHQRQIFVNKADTIQHKTIIFTLLIGVHFL